MAVTKTAHVGPAAGTTTITGMNFTASPVAGDLFVLWVVAEGATGPADPTNDRWGSPILSFSGGGVRMDCFVSVSDGTESGNVAQINIPGATYSLASIVTYRSATGSVGVGNVGSGADTTSGTGYSATTGSMASVSGGILAYCCALNNTSTRSSRALNQTGTTFTAAVVGEMAGGSGMTQECGNRQVTTGATATVTNSYTLGTASTGASGVVSLFEASTATTATLTTTLPKISANSAGVGSISAAAVSALPSMIADTTGSLVNKGTSANNLPKMIASSSGRGLGGGSIVGALSSLVASAIAEGLIGATLATSMPTISASSSGSLIDASSITMGMPAMKVDASGIASATSASSSTLPTVEASISGGLRSEGSWGTSLSPMQMQTTGRSSVGSTLAGSIAPASMSAVGEVEIPTNPSGTVDLIAPAMRSTQTGHSRAEGGLVGVIPPADLRIGSGSRASGQLGGTLAPPSASAEGSGRLGAEVALTLPTPSTVIGATSEEQIGEATLSLRLPPVGVIGDGFVVQPAIEGTLTVALPPMSLQATERAPAYYTVAWVEDDLGAMVEEDFLRITMETVDRESVVDERWHSYVEADWLEATT